MFTLILNNTPTAITVSLADLPLEREIWANHSLTAGKVIEWKKAA